jgi:Stress responsive A/B Barrel Domain
MPFRHVVLLRWADDVPEDHVEQVRAGLDALPAQIPQIRSFLHGSDVGVSEGNYDYVVVADFDNVGDWRTFREHPAHLLLMEEHITGRFTDRAAIQYQTPANRDPFEFSHARMQEFLAEVDELG